MNPRKRLLWLCLLTAGILVLCGCSSLTPVVDRTRFYILTPLPSRPAGVLVSSEGLTIGIGRVDLPDYLLPKQIALRKANSEIRYAETLQWAERLDKGIQRVLGVNLAYLLGPTNQVLTIWRRNEVRAEVYVSIQRFESDDHGEVTLETCWRITSPGAEETWQTRFSRIVKEGPSLAVNPDGAVERLGEALGDLSREIADWIKVRGEMRIDRGAF